jgi:hypothetical protein
MQLRWSPAAAEDFFRIIEYIQQEKDRPEEKKNGSQGERNGSEDPPLQVTKLPAKSFRWICNLVFPYSI